jgi:hypothetical protein
MKAKKHHRRIINNIIPVIEQELADKEKKYFSQINANKNELFVVISTNGRDLEPSLHKISPVGRDDITVFHGFEFAFIRVYLRKN